MSDKPMDHGQDASDELTTRRAMISEFQKVLERWPEARASSGTVTIQLNMADIAIFTLFLLMDRLTQPELSLTRRRR